jgi:phosphate transport system substrate-binding protein
MGDTEENVVKVGQALSNRYEIRKVLGQGGAGEVYSAWDTQLRRTVAIKRIRQGGLYKDPGLTEEAARSAWMEAMCLAAVRHPNIVAVYDLGMDENLPYLVMEFVVGETLDKRVQRGVLDVDEFIEVARQTLSGMVAAHQTGLVHRDIKPENLILTQMASGHPQVKILDFGIAKYLHQPEVQTMDLDGAIKGSVYWISPEQLNGDLVDERCDVYSLGCVFYFLLTGKPPFGTGNPTTVITAHLMHHVEPLHSLRADLPTGLSDWCMWMIRREPGERPQSALVALDKLETLAGIRRPGQYQGQAQEGSSARVGTDATATAETELIQMGNAPTMRIEMAKVEPEESVVSGPTKGGLSRAAWLRMAAVIVCGSAVGGWALLGRRREYLPAKPMAVVPPVHQPSECVMRLHGSNTIGTKLAPSLVMEYLKKNGARNVRMVTGASPVERRVEFLPAHSERLSHVELFGHGSKTAFSGLASAACDLGMTSSPISEADANHLEEKGLGKLRTPACEQVVGLDGLAILVHPSNPLSQLTIKQVFEAFAGKVKDWEELGRKPGGPIRLYARDESSGTSECFRSLVLLGQALSEHIERFEDSIVLSDRVALDPDGIGFAGLPFVRNCRAMAIGDDGTQALLPTRFTIATEDYLLSRRLYFYHSATLDHPMARDFIEFVLSDEGQEIVSDSGFIKQSVEVQKVVIPENSPAEYQTLANGAERLSLSLRFTGEQDRLDGKAERDLGRIFKAIERPRLKGHVLSLVAFTHRGQNEELDLKASLALAHSVAREFQTRGVQPDSLFGFGSMLSLASNESVAARDKNKRVEVWLRKSVIS